MHSRTNDARVATGVTAVILASGFARRMGQQKLLLPLADGVPMVRHVVETALRTSASRVLLVAPATTSEIAAACAELPVQVVGNAHPEEGMSASVRAAARVLCTDSACSGAVFLLGDMPDVQGADIDAVMDAYVRTGSPIIQACYRGTYGHPVLFGRSLFAELLEVTGDHGGRDVIARHRDARHAVHMDADLPPDIDTPEDYEAWLARHLRS